MRVRFLAIAGALVICIGGIAALVLSVGAAPHGDCDNLAGECLRHRQGLAITAVEAGCLVSLLVGAAYFVLSVRGRTVSRAALATLAVCGLLVTFVLVVHPVEHLNKRYGEWLSENP
jgi:hypothetical protein